VSAVRRRTTKRNGPRAAPAWGLLAAALGSIVGCTADAAAGVATVSQCAERITVEAVEDALGRGLAGIDVEGSEDQRAWRCSFLAGDELLLYLDVLFFEEGDMVRYFEGERGEVYRSDVRWPDGALESWVVGLSLPLPGRERTLNGSAYHGPRNGVEYDLMVELHLHADDASEEVVERLLQEVAASLELDPPARG
jgi:hypothetical protein